MPFDPVALLVLLSLLRCQHRPLFVTSQSCSGFSPWLCLRRCIQVPDGGNDICSPQKSGGDGESCHLAKPSGALYASDLHVSTCSKYNPLAFVDELRALRLPEGEMGGERERQCSWETFLCKKEKKEDSHSGMNHTAGRQRPIHVSEIHNIFQKLISGNGYHHVCVHRKLMTFSWQLVALLSGLQYKWSVVMQLGKMAFRFTANEPHEFWWFLYIYIQPGAAYTCHDE